MRCSSNCSYCVRRVTEDGKEVYKCSMNGGNVSFGSECPYRMSL